MSQQQKRAVLISCSDHYAHKLHVVDAYLHQRGYETTYLTSDFDHSSKQVFTCSVPGCRQIHVRPYQKNMSLDRILSHREFARKAFDWLEEQPQQPQMVVALLPPNFLAHYAARYKRRHPEVKLVFEIFDLWPETFPSGRMKRLLAFPFAVWAGLRDKNLCAADRVITECEMFRERLGLHDGRSRAIYLAGKRLASDMTAALAESELELCYLGAINNIIDIPAIASLVKELAECKPVTVHVIGEGEKRQELLQAVEQAGAKAVYHGAVYDEEKKQAIMARCHFGLNVMKPSVCVGLTMKSVDYWGHDLPILNNIPADTAQLVERERIGVNLGAGAVEKITALRLEELLAMRKNVHRVFDERFALPVILRQYEELLGELE